MARADLLCELIKYGILNDPTNFRKLPKHYVQKNAQSSIQFWRTR